jgi:hypothetical protein
MGSSSSLDLETDPRFPSGPWVGFFLQRQIPGRHLMELQLSFSQGVISGEGRDWVGEFIIRGRYDLADGKCYWTKRYMGKHDVFYHGFNEGKGIWGLWQMTLAGTTATIRDGFHIWPEGMGDASSPVLRAEEDLPVGVAESEKVFELVS